jgi:hypothetical protein
MTMARANPVTAMMTSGIPSIKTRFQGVSPIIRLFLSPVTAAKLVTQ